MCEPQSTSKYLNRNSPKFPANRCCDQEIVGNDGKLYISRRSSNGTCKWVPATWKTHKKPLTKKPSTKKSSVQKFTKIPQINAHANKKVQKLASWDRPAVMAKDFQNQTKRGNNGKMFISTKNAGGSWSWKPKVQKKPTNKKAKTLIQEVFGM